MPVANSVMVARDFPWEAVKLSGTHAAGAAPHWWYAAV
jgi:hypothetical protein